MKREDGYKEVIKEYSRRAGSYDLTCSRFLSTSRRVAIDFLVPFKNEKILDAGCGTGSLMLSVARELGEEGQLIGIDISQHMLQVAQEKLSGYKNIFLVRANLEHIPYPANYFNALVSVNVMHYWQSLLKVLKEFYRVLKPGGKLLLVGFCSDYWFFAQVERLWRIFIPSHIKAYSFAELSQKLREVGFKPVAGKRFRIGWFWRSMAIKARK